MISLRNSSLIVIALASILTACALPNRQVYTTSYNSAETKWFKTKGSGSVKGSIPQDLRSGLSCSGDMIALTPRSSYADENMMAFFGSLEGGSYIVEKVAGFTTNADAAYLSDRLVTRCDASGNFEFLSLPDGIYYLLADVRRMLEPHLIPGAVTFSRETGFGVMKRVEIRNGSAVEVTLKRDQ